MPLFAGSPEETTGKPTVLGWAIRCVVLVALGAIAVSELDLDIPHLGGDPGAGTATGAAAPRPAPHGDGYSETYGSELSVPAGRHGHFFVDATVDGAPIRFLIDTGATFVVLSGETAADLGIRPASHEYTVRMQTANGIIESAPVTLRQVRVGNFTAREVEALVTESPLGGALLGLSFLKRLQSYEVRRDRLILRW